jgi:hypothetical protein
MSLDLVTRKSPFGRPPKYENAEQLWSEFVAYAEHLEANPLIEVDYRGKDATEVNLKRMRPMTKGGFALFCGFSRWEDVDNQRKRGTEFSEIVTRVEHSIYNQKLEGAAAGFFNSSIIARDLGLYEGHKHQVEAAKLPPWMTDESKPEVPKG